MKITDSYDYQSFIELYNQQPFLKKWEVEGIAKPTESCLKLSYDIVNDLFIKHELNPHRIGPSVEEGILIVYWNASKKRALKIEVYNDLEWTGLVNEDKRIICVSDLMTVLIDHYKAV